MPKYTLVWISRWMVLGPRLWLLLALVLSLVVAMSLPQVPEPCAVWVWPDEVGRLRLRASRVGRWGWRLGRMVWASSLCLACRVGLIASLVAASGLAAHSPAAWYWVWLPVVDWALGVMGWLNPGWLPTPRYQAMRRITYQAYQWSVVWLGVIVLRRGLSVGPVGLLMGSVGVVSERDGSRVELEAVRGPEGQMTYRVHLIGEFVYQVTPRDEFEKRLVILDLRRLRTPGRESSRWGIVRQEDLAAVFDVFQEHISRWQTYVREGQCKVDPFVKTQKSLTLRCNLSFL